MKNETIQTKELDKDIHLICLPVPKFPEGIGAAFDELGAKFGLVDRDYYGISWMEGEQLIYMAAVAIKFEGEGKEDAYKPFTVQKGNYLSKTVHNWMQNIDSIKETFIELTKRPDFDFTYPCVEWYKTDTEMECWARAKQNS